MAKVVIHLGHSQSSGFQAMANLQVAYQNTYASIKAWNGTSFASLNYAVNNNQYPTLNNTFCSEFAQLTTLQTAWGEDVYFIHHAIGGSKVADDAGATTWYSTSLGEYYNQASSTINKALANMWKTLSIRSFEIYLIIYHGENDGAIQSDSLAFTTNMNNLISALITNCGGTGMTNTIKFIGIGQNNMNQGATYRANVLACYPSIVSNFSGTYNINSFDTSGYPMSDGTHYTAAGYQSYGNDIANYIISNDF